jgi:transposase
MKSSKTKKVKFINKKTMIASIDIGKNLHYGYFRAADGHELKAFSFYNTKKSFHQFWHKICQFKQQHQLQEIIIGFESTGPYAEPLYHYFKNKPVRLVQINPMHSKRVKELAGNSPNKTDRKDPRVIADIISLGHALTLVVPEGAAAHLRRLTQGRERALKARTAMLNQLQHLIFVIFPEFLSIMKNISTKTAAYLLKDHACPERIVGLGLDDLTRVMKKISRGRLGRQRAEQLFEAAKNSVGIGEGKASILLEIAHLNAMIANEDRFIASLEKQMGCYLEQIPYSGSLLSIKGLGVVTVAGLIGEVGDFKKFDTHAEIMKLAGFDLFEVSSGQHQGQRHISKRGRALMRKLLFFASINTVRSQGIMHARYHQMLDRGMLKMKALIAISRTLLRLIFALARDNTMYIENYDPTHKYKLAA